MNRRLSLLVAAALFLPACWRGIPPTNAGDPEVARRLDGRKVRLHFPDPEVEDGWREVTMEVRQVQYPYLDGTITEEQAVYQHGLFWMRDDLPHPLHVPREARVDLSQAERINYIDERTPLYVAGVVVGFLLYEIAILSLTTRR